MALDKDTRCGTGGETFICIRSRQVVVVMDEVLCLVLNSRTGVGTEGEGEREKIGKQSVAIHGSRVWLLRRDCGEISSAFGDGADSPVSEWEWTCVLSL